ncbi:MAG: hypothetical protein RMK89_07200 [Armatimonadota bacterium]|nr:hypothetical protein [Armatimonadota bacterium]MDW8143232.1 hypothetical protein [Armatimonadota bacterium]
MKQQVPTWLAVIIIVVVIAIAGFVVWKKAGEKPIVGFPEHGVPTHRGMPMHKGPMGKGPAAPETEKQTTAPENQPK